MERQGYINGDYCRAWTAQFAQEKVGGDHFIVEELLDFSNEEDDGDVRIAGGDDYGGGGGGSDVGRENCTADSPSVTTADSCINFFAGGAENQLNDELVFPRFADGGFSGELCEPYEELAELEWLSNFVEDSFSGEEVHKQQLLSGIKSTSSQPTPNADYHFPAAADDKYQPPFTFDAPVPVKTRSKRTRTAPRSWSTRLLLLAPITSIFPSENSDELQQSPIKKQARKKNPPAPADGRKCLHCASDKTPQWRSGPMGPKTLCNACGVRYKSGRLVPEYRPAASPTFVLCKHSNSHRKVMELRRQNEVQQHHLQFLPVYGGGVDAPAIAGGGDGFLIHQRLHADVSQVF